LDANKTLRKVKDEYSVIPSRIAKGLKSVIGLKIELDQTTKAVLASESLIRMFIELIGHYRNFINFNSENKQFQVLFINYFHVLTVSVLCLLGRSLKQGLFCTHIVNKFII